MPLVTAPGPTGAGSTEHDIQRQAAVEHLDQLGQALLIQGTVLSILPPRVLQHLGGQAQFAHRQRRQRITLYRHQLGITALRGYQHLSLSELIALPERSQRTVLCTRKYRTGYLRHHHHRVRCDHTASSKNE